MKILELATQSAKETEALNDVVKKLDEEMVQRANEAEVLNDVVKNLDKEMAEQTSLLKAQ